MSPTVLHLVRAYLRRTETFVYGQLAAGRITRPMVLTRELIEPERFPGPYVRAFATDARGWHRRAADLRYHLLRCATSYERSFYRRAAGELDPDLLHAHFAVDAAYFLDVARRLPAPLIVSCYGYDVASFPRRYGGFARLYLAPVWRRANRVLAMSADMRADLLAIGCPAEKIQIHYHGINLSRFPVSTEAPRGETTTILFIGSLGVAKKGVPDLIHAFAAAITERPALRLRLVGSGQEQVEPLVRALGIEAHVSFGGFVSHERLRHEHATAHIFCHPSRTAHDSDKEGIPGTLVEAMASGMAVLSTRHAGIPEIVRDGIDGLLVREGDRSALTRALLQLAADSDLRRQLGRSAAQRARDCADLHRQMIALERIYNETLHDYNKGKLLCSQVKC